MFEAAITSLKFNAIFPKHLKSATLKSFCYDPLRSSWTQCKKVEINDRGFAFSKLACETSEMPGDTMSVSALQFLVAIHVTQ